MRDICHPDASDPEAIAFRARMYLLPERFVEFLVNGISLKTKPT